MEHLTLEKVALLIGQLQLSVVNLENYIEKLTDEIEELKVSQNYSIDEKN
jgi:hypothetical protein